MKKLSLDEILQSVGVLSVVASLIFVGLELRQGNLLAQMEASDRAYQGSVASREMQLLYTKEWLEGATNNEEITDEAISDEASFLSSAVASSCTLFCWTSSKTGLSYAHCPVKMI